MPQFSLNRSLNSTAQIACQKGTNMANTPETGPLKTASVYALVEPRIYSGSEGDYVALAHDSILALGNSTISLGFSLDRLADRTALISKDGTGTNAGDFTVWIKDMNFRQLAIEQEDVASIVVQKLSDGTENIYSIVMSQGSSPDS